MYRRERIDAGRCGIYDFNGPGFIKANIVRDILALNKVEAMPWDSGWGLLENYSLKEVERGELGGRVPHALVGDIAHLVGAQPTLVPGLLRLRRAQTRLRRPDRRPERRRRIAV